MQLPAAFLVQHFFFSFSLVFSTTPGVMDSPIVTQLIRQLFRHRASHPKRNLANLTACLHHASRIRQQTRSYSAPPRGPGGKPKSTLESDWQQRTELFPADMTEEFE